MIYNTKNSSGLMLVDSRGTAIPYAYEFNDETSEVKFYMIGKRNGETKLIRTGSLELGLDLVSCTAVIPGAKMISRTEKETTL
jgi:hypothetical protein